MRISVNVQSKCPPAFNAPAPHSARNDLDGKKVLKSGPRFRQRWHHQTVGAYPTVTIGQMRPVWHRGSPAHGLCQAGSHTLRDLS